jgi:hypothetical protein
MKDFFYLAAGLATFLELEQDEVIATFGSALGKVERVEDSAVTNVTTDYYPARKTGMFPTVRHSSRHTKIVLLVWPIIRWALGT